MEKLYFQPKKTTFVNSILSPMNFQPKMKKTIIEKLLKNIYFRSGRLKNGTLFHWHSKLVYENTNTKL